MSTRTVEGTYGSANTPCDVFVYETRSGGSWYVCEGSVNVNYTHDPVNDGVDVETLTDEDMFTWNNPIESEDDLETAVEA